MNGRDPLARSAALPDNDAAADCMECNDNIAVLFAGLTAGLENAAGWAANGQRQDLPDIHRATLLQQIEPTLSGVSTALAALQQMLYRRDEFGSDDGLDQPSKRFLIQPFTECSCDRGEIPPLCQKKSPHRQEPS